MDIMELIFIGLISLSLIFMILALFNGFKFFEIGKKINLLKRKRIKNKQKRKRTKKIRIFLEKQKQKKFKSFSICLIISFLLLGSYYFLKDYTSKNLSKEDMATVMKAYFLIKDYEVELNNARESIGSKEEVEKKLSDMSSKMSSYMVETPSERISIEGRRILNRYYKNISELGINTVNLNKQFYGNPESADEYIENIANIKSNEKELFTFFKIDESRIKEK